MKNSLGKVRGAYGCCVCFFVAHSQTLSYFAATLFLTRVGCVAGRRTLDTTSRGLARLKTSITRSFLGEVGIGLNHWKKPIGPPPSSMGVNFSGLLASRILKGRFRNPKPHDLVYASKGISTQFPVQAKRDFLRANSLAIRLKGPPGPKDEFFRQIMKIQRVPGVPFTSWANHGIASITGVFM